MKKKKQLCFKLNRLFKKIIFNHSCQIYTLFITLLILSKSLIERLAKAGQTHHSKQAPALQILVKTRLEV